MTILKFKALTVNKLSSNLLIDSIRSKSINQTAFWYNLTEMKYIGFRSPTVWHNVKWLDVFKNFLNTTIMTMFSLQASSEKEKKVFFKAKMKLLQFIVYYVILHTVMSHISAPWMVDTSYNRYVWWYKTFLGQVVSHVSTLPLHVPLVRNSLWRMETIDM